MLQSLWAQAAGGGKLRWKQDPSAKALGLCVTAARLEIPRGRARLFKCFPYALCSFVFWGKAIQNPLPPLTLPINSPPSPFIFSAIYRALFQVRRGSKKQVPCIVVSLGHRMQRFIVRGGYPFPPWIFSANVSVTLCERLMQITLPQSQSLQRK